MAKKTLLEIVQEVLNDLDDDFVNSINDSEEAQQIANMAQSTYQAMLSNRNWPHTKRTVNLVPFSDNTLPTHMRLQNNIKELISIYYEKHRINDTDLKYQEVFWKEPDEFLRYTYGRNSSNSTVNTIVDPTGVKLLIMNNKAPDYFTSFDDVTLVFDSWDNMVDSTLQSAKTNALAYIMPDFTIDDSFIPDLPEEAFTAFIEELKSKAAFKLKQIADEKSEQESKRQQSWLSRKAWRAHGGLRYPDYGRKRGRREDATFRKDRN